MPKPKQAWLDYEAQVEEEEEQEEQEEELSEEDEARARGDFIEEEDKEEPKLDSPPAEEPAEEPTEEPAEEPVEDEPDEEPAPKNIMLPKARYDHAMARAREAERKLAELQRQGEETEEEEEPAVDPLEAKLVAVDAELAEAIAEGRTQDISRLSGETRRLERQLWQRDLNATSARTQQATTKQVEYDSFLERVEAARPELNPDAEEFDEDVTSEVAELVEAFQAKGTAPAAALRRALTYVFPGGWENAGESEPEPKAKPAPRKTNVERNLKARKSQPPALKGGVDSDKAGVSGELDPMKLSDEDFAKLTDSQLARMRGDEF